MVISLILLFISCFILSFYEERIIQRDRVILYILIGIGMILIAGMRAVGSTPDTDAYEMMYYGKSNVIVAAATEPSFNIISYVLHSMSLGINSLFFAYAIISVPIHLVAFWKLSKIPFVTLTIYVSYYYMMHEMVQIRAGVAAGLFLLSLYYYVEKKKKIALLFIFLGTFFHYSALVGLVMFLFKDKLPTWQKAILCAIIPIGLVVYFTRVDLSLLIPESLIGSKLALYREMRDKGVEEELAGWPLEINILIWMNFILFYASIFYSEFLMKHCKYVNIAIKLQAAGFIFLLYLNGVSQVLGNRINDYFSVANIILWTASVYAFTPRIVSKIISNAISTFRFATSALAYALSLWFL
ncbi:MAG: EpsG family protein [Prevotella sp.]|nr:EpsG family protein [Prevotella sp.]